MKKLKSVIIATLLLLPIFLPVAFAAAPSVSSPADIAYNASETGNNITWTVTDDVNATGNYTVYRNGTNVATGVWTNNTAFNISADGLTGGYAYNFTIDVTDGSANATDALNVTVNALPVNPASLTVSPSAADHGDTVTITIDGITDSETAEGSHTVKVSVTRSDRDSYILTNQSATWTSPAWVYTVSTGLYDEGTYDIQVYTVDESGGEDLDNYTEQYSVQPAGGGVGGGGSGGTSSTTTTSGVSLGREIQRFPGSMSPAQRAVGAILVLGLGGLGIRFVMDQSKSKKGGRWI